MPTASVGDHELAHKLAGSVGEQLLCVRQDWQRRSFTRGMSLAYEGDISAHNSLLKELRAARSGDAVLSEEGTDNLSRLKSKRLWVIDPLDGSSDYAYGSSEWAVHVGLAVDGVAVAGAVSLPALDLIFATGQSQGKEVRGRGAQGHEAQRGQPAARASQQTVGSASQQPAAPDKQTAASCEQPFKIVTARSRIHLEGVLLANELEAEVFACGSAGVKAMLVVLGKVDAYVHATGLYEWDVCAPAAVAESAGLYVSDAFGEQLKFNQPHPVVNGFVVCRHELAEPIFAVLQDSHLGVGKL